MMPNLQWPLCPKWAIWIILFCSGFVVAALVSFFTEPDEPKWTCFDGYLGRSIYYHSWPTDIARRLGNTPIYLCGQDLKFVGPGPVPGAQIANKGGADQ